MANFTGSLDPRIGSGVSASIGSSYRNLNTGDRYEKIGSADTAWEYISTDIMVGGTSAESNMVIRGCPAGASVGDYIMESLAITDGVDVATGNADARGVIGVISSKPNSTTARIQLLGAVDVPEVFTKGGYVFLGTSGRPTSVVPTTGWVQVLGTAVDSNRFDLSPAISRIKRYGWTTIPPLPIITPNITPATQKKYKSVSRFRNYVAVSWHQSYGGFDIFDTSNVQVPVALGRGNSSWSVNKTIWLDVNRLLVLVNNNPACIESWNLSNKSSPVRNQVIAGAGSSTYYDFDVNADHTLCAAANNTAGVHLFDISNPVAITQIGSISGISAGNVRIRGTNLWVTNFTTKTLLRYSLANPASPVLTFTAPITGSTNPSGLEVSEDEKDIIVYEDSLPEFYMFKDTGTGPALFATKSVATSPFGAQGSSSCIIDNSRDLLYMTSGAARYVYHLSTGELYLSDSPGLGSLFGCTSGVGSFVSGFMIYGLRSQDRFALIPDPCASWT